MVNPALFHFFTHSLSRDRAIGILLFTVLCQDDKDWNGVGGSLPIHFKLSLPAFDSAETDLILSIDTNNESISVRVRFFARTRDCLGCIKFAVQVDDFKVNLLLDCPRAQVSLEHCGHS